MEPAPDPALGARRAQAGLDAGGRQGAVPQHGEDGWDNDQGGLYYTLDWNDRPDQADRFWWPCAEGIAAAAVIGSVDPDPRFEEWYRRILGFTENHLIDHANGGWFPELGPDLKPVSRVFSGKPDLYHALQACLIPLLPSSGSITRGLQGGLKL